jgi:formyl-CoA transferase/CoA:oxalate CoA-transferase
MWEKLARLLDRPEWLKDERFADPVARVANRDALTAELEAVLATRDVDEWVGLLNDAGIPAGPVLDLAQVFRDPQVRAREMLVELAHPEVGVFKTTGLPVKLSRTPGAIRRAPPLPGEHTDEVLREAGLPPDEIAALRRDGLVA